MNEKYLIEGIKKIINKSDFYKAKISSNLVKLKSFRKIPFTTKQEILCDQELFPPFGSNICCNIEKIKRIHKTSGTTNKPVLIGLTDNDIALTTEIGAKCFKNSGLKKNDIVVHCLNYNMWSGGVTDHMCLERAGASVIPFGVGNTKNLIEIILRIKPSAIHCTPSYLSKIEDVLKNEFNLKPLALNLRLGLFGGESGIQNSDLRKSLELKWGFKAMNANYGLSEVMSILASESENQDGLRFRAGKYVYPELIDVNTRMPLPFTNGTTGELVLTNVSKECMPLIRYLTGDIIKIIDEKISNASNSFRFKIIGRTDNMFVVRGINIFLSAIEDYISNFLNYFNGIYRIYINKKDPVDRIEIFLEYKSKYYKKLQVLKEKFIKGFKENFEIKPEINFVKEGYFPRNEGKSKKLFREL